MHLPWQPLLSLCFRWGAELWAGACRAGGGATEGHGGGAEPQSEETRGGPGGGSRTRSSARGGVEEEEGLRREGGAASERPGSATVHLWEEGEPGDEAEDTARAGAEEFEGTTGKPLTPDATTIYKVQISALYQVVLVFISLSLHHRGSPSHQEWPWVPSKSVSTSARSVSWPSRPTWCAGSRSTWRRAPWGSLPWKWLPLPLLRGKNHWLAGTSYAHTCFSAHLNLS